MVLMNFVVIALLSCSASAAPIPKMRKEQKSAMAVQASGAIQDVSPRKSSAAVRTEKKAARGAVAIAVESTGMLENMPADADALQGPVADALHSAKAELENQITEQEKAKQDTDLALERAMLDKEQKEAELAKALEMYNYWLSQHALLTEHIQNITNTISSLTNLSNSQQTELDRLRTAAAAKHDAAMMAGDLEATIESLKDQIAQKEQFKVDTEATHETLAAKQKTDCDAAVQQLSDSISNITSAINDAQAELDLLTAQHTEVKCSEKEAKNENICKRCSTGEPCGDTCISANKTCYHDLGCACKDDNAASLLEDEPSEDDDAHPLQKQLRDAKAQLRKIIAQHQQTIDGLTTDIQENEARKSDLQREKQRAMEDYDNSLKELSDQKAQLTNSSNIATKNKVQAEKDLAEAISTGTAAIEKLAGELRDSITEMKAERARQEDARSTQITTCEEDMKALLDSQGNVISAIKSELEQLKQQKKDAESELEDIKGKHDIVTVPTVQPGEVGHCETKPTLCESANKEQCTSDTYLAVWSVTGTEAKKMCKWEDGACKTKPTLCESASSDQCTSDTYLAVWSTAGTEAKKMCKWVADTVPAGDDNAAATGDGDGDATTAAPTGGFGGLR